MEIEVNAEFADLLEIAGLEGARAVLGEMESHGPSLLDSIDDAVQAGDFHAVAQAAHSLKSSCGALSLTASAGLASQIEASALSVGTAGLDVRTKMLRATFLNELSVIRGYIEQNAAKHAAVG